MGLEANSAVIVAALDLSLVQLLRQAIRFADLTVAAERQVEPTTNTCDNHRRYCPCNQESAQQNSTVVRAFDRYEPSLAATCAAARACPPAPVESSPVEVIVVRERDPIESPLQPPWKVLPWENPPQPSQIIKVVQYQPDTTCKGTVLDCFI